MNPSDPLADVPFQVWTEATDAVKRSTVALDQLERMNEVDVGTAPHEVVYTENKLELHHYEARTDEQHPVPILIVYALINKPYILDLQPNRSVVRTLLDNGFDVYMIDWGEPSQLDAHLTLGDYVTRYIDNCVDVVSERSGADAVNLLGYCMGGTMSAMYASLYPEKVRTLGLMAAGLNFDDTGGVLELWGGSDHYSPEAITETFGNVPAEFLEVGFDLLDPVNNYVTKYLQLYENLEDDDFVENFARMEKWINDGIDVPGETYRQFIEDIYQENKLILNELDLDGTHVDIENITMPVLNIVGSYDHLIPPESSKPFNDAVPSDDTTVIEFPSGHIGLSVSSKSHAELWPDVAAWFEQRSDAPPDDAEPSEGGTPAGETDPGTETSETDDASETKTDAEPAPAGVESIEGIGPAYADRLRESGIETSADLAAADPEDAERIGVPQARLERWIDRAVERLES